MKTITPSKELTERMRRASRKAIWIMFVAPVLLLVGIGVLADRTTESFARSEHWVAHTHEVQMVIESLRADVYIAQDAHDDYVLAGDSASLAHYRQQAQQISIRAKNLAQLTADNQQQRSRTEQLEVVVQRELAVLQESADLKSAGAPNAGRQAELAQQNVGLATEMDSILTRMAEQEQQLLQQRVVVSTDTYHRMRIALALAFLAVVVFLFLSFGRLLIELRSRMRAEGTLRRLSGRILQLQDLERRRIARELHDGVGQYFASSKMVVDSALQSDSLSDSQRKALSEAAQLLEQGIAEARTLSYLLHPPLLDEVGFRAAAEWFIAGFSERSGIKVQFAAPADLAAMTKEIELALFRILQEALTNIHRHASSATAEVRIYSRASQVTLEVEDHGTGIPQPLLDDLRRSTGRGVGLAGMRERVSEFQGRLEVKSHRGQGTLLRAEIPLPPTKAASASDSGVPNVQERIREQRQTGPAVPR
jgi:signal transduction histidine kinase